MGLQISSKKIYLWSIAYLVLIFFFSEIFPSYGVAIWVLYLVLALPFYNHLDKYLMICFLLSTLSDYFSGVGEGIMGLFSVLLFLMIVNICMKKTKFAVGGQMFPLLLIACIWISYLNSAFNYINGAYSMTYAIFVCIMIMGLVKVENDTLDTFLPIMTAIVVVYIFLVLLLRGYLFGIMISINPSINHNAFGRCLALLSTILAVKVFTSNVKELKFTVPWVLTIILTLMTGSRSAFLALALSVIFAYVVCQRQSKKKINKYVIAIIVVLVVVAVAYWILPYLGIDLERYNFVELAETGGTNRSTIWKLLIPLLLRNYLFFGYGPGYFCSASIVSSLVHRAYTNTHNIFMEVWGELGLVGLGCFVGMIYNSFREAYLKLDTNPNVLYVLALFVDIFVNGIGEATFAGMYLWIIIALCYSVRKTL